jgi:hypothetical protein
MFIRLELEDIPVERLVENLNKAAQKDPKNVRLLVNLARAHGMAYALKVDTVEVFPGKLTEGAWFGHTPKYVPFSQVKKTDDPKKVKVARAHLAQALTCYEKAVKLDPRDPAAGLGYAWTLEQAGKKQQAIKEYRQLLRDAWATDKDLQSLPISGNTITIEAAGYLIPLLDSDKDREEIATLTERRHKLAQLPRPITPLVVPLRDGLTARDLEDRTARVAFDADGSGLSRSWTWVTRDAAWLVYAPRGEKTTSALQLFGGVSFWMFWSNGYDALSSLDDNADGRLTGKELQGLALWHDGNGNGICDPGEVKSLADWGIVGLSCRFLRDPGHPDRIVFSPAGVVFRDGKTRPTYDLVLHPWGPDRKAASRQGD